MKITTGFSLTLAGLSIAALGVVAPIAWDWWSKRAEITVETRQSVTILQKEQSLTKLTISYDGRPIDSLNKTTLALKNNGRIPIIESDVVEPVRISFQHAQILEISSIRQTPSNLGASVLLSGNTATINLKLLNPNDEVELSILTAEGVPDFTADARIRGVSSISLVGPVPKNQLRNKIGWPIWVASGFSAIFVFFGISMMKEIAAKRVTSRELKSGTGRLYSAATKQQVSAYLAGMRFLLARNKSPVLAFLAECQEPLNDQAKETLRILTLAAIDADDSVGPAIAGFTLAIFGFAYAIYNVIT
jgi:hypothetical protein